MYKQTKEIWQVLQRYGHPESVYNAQKIQDQIESAVSVRKKLRLVLPAFPGKSINQKSVFGPLPDYGEYLALRTLGDFARAVRDQYEPGAHINVFCDGHLFGRTGCMRMPAEINQYTNVLKEHNNSSDINLIDIHDLYQDRNVDTCLERFYRESCPDGDSFRQTLLSSPGGVKKYQDRSAFVYHEFSQAIFPDKATAARQEKSKKIALEFLRVEEGLSKLLESTYPNAIRLSIHKQTSPLSSKFCINLLPGVIGRGAPWYHVVAIKNGQEILCKRETFESGHDVLRKDVVGFKYLETTGVKP